MLLSGVLRVTTLVWLVNLSFAMRRWPFFTAPELTFESGEAFNTLTVDYPCTCKSVCLAMDECLAWTAVQNGSKWECLHTQVGPSPSFNLTKDSSSVYGYFEDSLLGIRDAVQAEDDYHYFIPNTTLMFNEAKDYCESIPGFRLAIFRTEQQMNFSLALASAYNIERKK
nr:uncharacterized protein LOC128686308 [Cherax quadricarinatus]